MTRPSQSAEGRTRRTEGVRCRGRSARVVEDVLTATAEELGRVGFAALRVEDVAARAKVNKTTVYRRWSTKTELVHAALVHALEPPEVPDTGDLRGDVRALVNQTLARVASLQGRGVLRMIQAERLHPEFAELVRGVRSRHNAQRRKIFERAIERGEIPIDNDPALLVELLMAPLVTRVVHLGIEADARFIDVLVEASLAVARSSATAR